MIPKPFVAGLGPAIHETKAYYEHYDDIRDARQREQNMKRYPRAWKVRLILLNNPNWDGSIRPSHLIARGWSG
jgi:hypothetical protein